MIIVLSCCDMVTAHKDNTHHKVACLFYWRVCCVEVSHNVYFVVNDTYDERKRYFIQTKLMFKPQIANNEFEFRGKTQQMPLL